MPIKPTSSGSPVPNAEYGAMQGASAPSSPESSDTSLSRKRGVDLQLAPLQTKRRSGEKTGDEGARFNADLGALGETGLSAGGSGQESRMGPPGTTPGSAPARYQRSLTIPERPLRRSWSAQGIPKEHSEPRNAHHILNEERKYKNSVNADLPSGTISPHLAALIGTKSSNENLISAIAAMKPGSAEIQAGFRQVELARTFDTVSPEKSAKKLLGKGRYGAAYEVRLSENFFRKGQDLGRDFVFKAMLREDMENPLPRNLYDRLSDNQGSADLAIEVSKEKDRIFSEFQIAASLAHTSRVMQVHGLVQIGDEFGILAEKIEGETARDLLGKSIDGLEKRVISPEEHLRFARQVVADVLVGISRFADEGVTHLDISPNNVIYDKKEKHFKLIDMGKGREEGEAKEPGTNGYIDIFIPIADQKSDVYSAGQLLAYFVRDPKYPVGPMGLFGGKTVDDFPFMSGLAKLSAGDKENIVSLINRMIEYQVADRPTAQQVLRDPFLMNPAPPDQIHAHYERLNNLSGN